MRRALAYLRRSKLKFWDMRIEESSTSTISVRNRYVSDVDYEHNHKYSIRVLGKSAFGFVHSSDFSRIVENARKAVKISRLLEKKTKPIKIAPYEQVVADKREKLADFSTDHARKRMLDASMRAREYSRHIKDMISNYSQKDIEKSYYNSEGSEILQNQQYSEGYMAVTAKKGSRTETYSNSFPDFRFMDVVTDRTCKYATDLLNAKELKTGRYKVLLDNELTGVFIHEALGHCLEADNIINRSSVLWDKKGKKIASNKVTVIDDPQQEGYGFYHFDEEGIPGKKTVLIKNGVLKKFMHSRETAAVMKEELTGNGRCQDTSTRPIVRMSNTYMAKRRNTFDQLLEKLKDGLYLMGENSGEVDSATGEFEFSVKAAYKIKNYTIDKMYKNVSFMGNLLDILKNVEAVGNTYDIPKPSYCEKDGQVVPVDGFNPAVLIKDSLVVGNE